MGNIVNDYLVQRMLDFQTEAQSTPGSQEKATTEGLSLKM